MLPTWLRPWIRQATRTGSGRLSATRRKLVLPLEFEPLEERLAPALSVWDGGGADALWTNRFNWVNDVAPQQDDDLTFPVGAAQLTNTNDFAAGTRFGTIRFDGTGYDLTGNSIALTQLQSGSTGLSNRVDLPLQVAFPGGPLFFDNAAGTSVTMAGTITNDAAAAILKFGAGTIVLAQNNPNLLGTITISQGILEVQNAGALGSGVQATTIANGATLQVNNVVGGAIPETIILNGSGVGGLGALRNLGGNNTLSGNITLALSTTIDTPAGELTLSGVVDDAGASSSLTKTGTGRLVLSGSNTYAGITFVNQGVVNVQNTSALGSTSGDTVVASGATLETQSSILGEALRVSGTGVGGLGALRNVAGNNSWTGTVTLLGNTSIGGTAGTDLNISGSIGDGGLNFNLTKVDAGRLILSAANTYGGLTDIQAGVLSARNIGALGVPNSTTVASGAALEIETSIFGEALTLAGSGVANTGALRNTLGNNIWSGAVTLTSPGAAIGSNLGQQLTITGTIGEAGGAADLTKVENGRVVLPIANTYTGQTIVNAGTLAIQNDGALGVGSTTTVNNGGTLQLLGPGLNPTEPLTLTGDGDASVGALRNSGGNNSWSGPITLTGPLGAALGADAGTVLTINTTIGETGGAAGLRKLGTGEVILPNANTYSGDTRIQAGTLTIRNNNALGTPANGTFVAAGGSLDLDGSGGNLTITSEALTLNGTGFNNTGALRSMVGQNSWSGNVTLASNSQINVDAGRLTISGSISEAAAGTSLSKGGPAVLDLTNSNSYSGLTNVLAGTLVASNTLALGTAAQGTVVSTGAALHLNNVSVFGEALTIAGTGVGGTGALRNLAGNQVWSGTVTLSGNASIVVDAATQLTLSGVVGNSGGSFDLTKDGTGRLVLTNANTYGGVTRILAGAVNIQNNNALGLTTNGTIVSNGAALELVNVTVGAEALTLQGTGLANTGALHVLNGVNSWAGTVTLAGNTLLTTDAGTSLTISGTIGESVLAPTFTKDGPGRLILPNANTYTGQTLIQNGVVNIRNGQSLGAITGNTVVSTGAALEVQGGITSAEPLQISGSGVSGTGALRNVANDNTLTGPIVMSANSAIGADVDTTMTLSGVISEAAGTLDLTKVGLGRVILTAANTYKGLTTVNLGALRASNPQALGDPAGAGTHVLGGAALELTTSIAGESLALNGLGPNTTGALRNVSGTNFWSGPISLETATAIGSDADTLQITGIISSVNSAAVLTKVGQSVIILTAANTYTSQTIVLEGSLNLRNPLALGTPGGSGTSVLVGAALQLEGGLTILNEPLQINGFGPMNLGALQSVSGDNTWQGTVLLSSDSSIGVTDGTKLTINGPVDGATPTDDLFKVGTGRLVYTGVLANTLLGVTTVADGTLELNKPNGIVSLAGDLHVGDTIGAAGSARVVVSADGQFTSTIAVSVVSEGVLDLQNHSGAISSLSIDNGVVNLGAGGGGIFTVNGPVTLTQGTIDTGIANTLALRGDVTTSSSLLFPSAIVGVGFVDLGNGTRTFNVGLGALPVGLVIDAHVVGVGGGLIKNGLGTMVLNNDNTYTGTTTINAGVLAVNGSQPGSSVALTNGTLTGDGAVGQLNATGGLVNPGSVFSTVLTSLNTTFNSATTFHVDLLGLSLGSQYDQLNVLGTAALGNATLDINLGFVPPIGAVFTIIATTAGVSGTFNGLPENADIFLNGLRFKISYLADGGTDVTLTRVQASTTTSLVSSVNPSVFGQNVTFTATVTPNGGATGTPTGTVTFVIDAGAPQVVALVNGTASISTASLAVGPHSVVATYNGDVDFATSSGSLTQTVNKASTTATLTSGPNPSRFGQPVTFNVTVAAVSPGAGIPSGNVTLRDNGVDLQTVALVNGTAQFIVSSLPAATHTIDVVYAGDSSFLGTTSNTVTQVVQPSDTTTTLVSSANPSVFGQSVTFTATVSAVAPGAGIPTGTVSFRDNGIEIGIGTLSGGVAQFTTSALALGTHPITAVYVATSNFNSSTSNVINQVVNQASTTTSLTSAPNPSVHGQAVTFTATVTPVNPATGVPTGQVVFLEGMTAIGTADVNAAGVATLTISTLLVGSHAITATYTGDTNYKLSDSNAVTQVVNKANTTTTIVSSVNPSRFGETVTITATISAVAPGAGTPAAGTVTFFIDGVAGTPVTVVSGQAAFTFNNLPAGPHSITATYSGDASFNGSSTIAPLNQDVLQTATTTSLSATANPAVVGQSITLVATVSPVAPGGGVPVGSVAFDIDGSVVIVNLDATGHATLGANFFTAGVRNITATYLGSANHAGSISQAFTEVVNPAETSIALNAMPPASVFGQTVTFTATVSVVPPGTNFGNNLGGTVTFVIDGNPQTPVAVDPVTGLAVLTSSTLPAGNHTITVSYSGDANYLPSTLNMPLTYTVNQASTTTTLSSSANPSVFGQTVITAQVAAVAPGAGIPDGTVTFLIDGVTQVNVPVDAAGVATLPGTSLSAGTHTVTASYNGSANFSGSAGNTLTQTVDVAATTISLSSSVNPSVFGQPFTLTATISPVAPAGGTPTGTVAFVIDGAVLPPVSVVNGIATITFNSLGVGTYNFTAGYSGDSNFQGSVTAAPLTQVVQPANVTIGLTSSANPAVFGQPVTFTATVTPVAPGAGIPSGQVTFLSDDQPIGTVNLVNGVAQLTTGSLPVGAHVIRTTYAGDGSFNAQATSPLINQAINKADATLSLQSSVNPSVFGQNVVFTVTATAVPPSVGIPTGNVVFTVDGVTLLPVPLINGQATLSPNALSVGSHTVSVAYAGDAGFNAATPASLVQTVNQAATSLALTSSVNPSVFGQPVTFTLTVTPVAPGSGQPTGSVIFTIDGVPRPAVGLNALGQATHTLADLGVGSHTVSATYSGDGNFTGGTATLPTQQVNQASTQTTVVSSNPTSVFGQPVTFTATVSPIAPGAGTPQGNVTFFDGAINLGSFPLVGGTASLTTGTLGVATHQITAVYSGDISFAGSTSAPITQTVNQATTSTTVDSSLSPSVFGQSVTFTATVAAQFPGAGVPTGTVTFFDGLTNLGQQALLNGVATLTTSQLGGGNHAITAVYSGDASFQTSTSPVFTQVVNSASTTSALSAAPTSVVAGQPVTLTATVTTVAPGSGTPVGSVTFFDGGTPIGTVALAGGTAALVTTSLNAGSHNITFVYDGNANFGSSSSNAVSVTVTQANTSTTVNAIPQTGVFGQPITLQAVVTPTAPGGGVPTGTVTFTIDGQTLAPITLTNGTAQFVVNSFAVGGHTVSAAYSGSGNYAASTSPTTNVAVNKASTSTNLVSSVNPTTAGQSVTFTATVAAVAPGAGQPTGTVNFLSNGNPIGSGTLTNGVASITVSNLPAGANNITAIYAGDTNFIGSTSQVVTQTVNRANTTLVVGSSNPATVFGQAVTFTATISIVAPGSGTPMGVVTFFDGGTALGGAAVSGGVAVFSTSALSVGSHNITAQYSGDSNFNGATSPAITQSVGQAATTTSVVSSANPSVFGQSTTFTITVAAAAPGAGTPTGSVTLFDGAFNLGTFPLTNGVATFSTGNLGIGSHPITATYSGDGNFTASTSPVVNQVVGQASTTTLESSSVNPSVAGQPVTFTATVSAAPPGAGLPTGTVTFSIDNVPQAPVQLNGLGQASITVSNLGVGPHNVTAAYSGNVQFLASTSPGLTQTVNQASTSTTVTPAPNPSVFGQNVTLTAVVTPTAPGAGLPTGTVTFFSNGTSLGTANVVNGTATFQTTTLPTGTPSITATYSGDANFTTSTSSAVTQTVNPASTSTALTSSANPAVAGQGITFTATVTAVPPGAGVPTGLVTFFIDGTTQVQAPLNSSGQATINLSLQVGSHVVTASYGGSADFAASNSQALNQTVNKANAAATVQSSLNPSVFGQSVTFTATVTAVAPGTGTPTGSVTFLDNGIALGTAPLNAQGVATFATTVLGTGNHTITVAYSGDANFSSASSTTPVIQTVTRANTTTTIPGSSINPSVFGQSVTIIAAVVAVAPGAGTPQGTVTFTIDGVAQTPTAVDSTGRAMLTLSSLSVGPHQVTATYNGDANFSASSTAAPFTQTVNPSGTTTSAVSSSVNPSVFGQTVTFTATVAAAAPGAGTPTGNVTFLDGSTPLGTATLVNGQASFSVSNLTVGTHAITAAYSGDTSFNGSASATALTQTVNKAATTTSNVTSSRNPSEVGQPVTFTVTVAGVAPGAGAPTGTVRFLDGSTSLGTATLSNGTASLTVSTLTAGSHSITATFEGDANFGSSTSPTALLQVVGKANTTTTVTSSVNPSVFGQTVVFTATVAAVPPAGGTPTGTVTFSIDGTAQQPVAVGATGTATLSRSDLSAGAHVVTATYNGSDSFNASTSTTALTQTVNRAGTSTALTSSPNPSQLNQTVTLVATIGVAAPGTGSPGGTVTFLDGSTVLGTVPVTGGRAQLSVNSLTVGTHTLTASYAGDANFAGSTSTGVSQTVNALASSVSLQSSANPSAVAAPVTFTATISVPPGGSAPTGTVSFFDGATQIGVAPVSGNSATFTTSTLGEGTHSITARYSGSTVYAGSTSAALSQSVITLNQDYVNRLYVDLLGRAPDAAGLAFWTGLLNAGVSRYDVALAIQSSPEYRTNQIQSLYQQLLGRQADAQGLAFFLSLMAAGGNIRQVESIILSSDEYYNTQGGGTINGFLQALYQDVLHRPIDAVGQATFELLLSNNFTPRRAVCDVVVYSEESNVMLVQSYYQQYLGRAADAGGLIYWTGALAAGATPEQVLAGILSSDEFFLEPFGI